MPFYLSEYQGAGTIGDPFTPVGSEQPGWAGIDLRPDASRLDGGGLSACLLWVPAAFSDARARLLGDDKLDGLSNQQKNFLQNRLGVNVSAATSLRDVIATLMNSPPANGWKAILPGRTRWEIWLGELIWEAPRASGGATDDFNRANETPLAAPWAEAVAGDNMNLTTNQVVGAAGGDKLYYYSGAAASANQYAQMRFTSTPGDSGPACRVSSLGTFDCYFHNEAGAGYAKFVAGSFSNIASDGDAFATSDVSRLEVEGTTLRLFRNGSPTATPSTTDSSLSAAGLGVGFAHFGTTNTLDDWEGGNIGEAPVAEVAFDAATESVRTATTDPYTFDHTPAGTPAAVVLTAVHGTSSTDHISTVTYGGVSMSRVVRATDTATEPGAAEIWFLGKSVPTGTQTLSIDLTSATTDDFHFVAITLTSGGGGVEVIDSDSVSADQANPSVTLQYGGRTAIAVGSLYGGGADGSAFAPNANCTTVHDHDLGNFYSETIRQTTPGTADFAIGGTAASDDVAYVAAAFSRMRSAPVFSTIQHMIVR
jgi:hypothetical protein